MGWLNNSKFLRRTIWQPKAGARDTSLPQIAFVKQVWEETAGPLQRQIDLLTSKQKCAVSEWWLIWEDIGNQRELKYCWCDIKSISLHSQVVHQLECQCLPVPYTHSNTLGYIHTDILPRLKQCKGLSLWERDHLKYNPGSSGGGTDLCVYSPKHSTTVCTTHRQDSATLESPHSSNFHLCVLFLFDRDNLDVHVTNDFPQECVLICMKHILISNFWPPS